MNRVRPHTILQKKKRNPKRLIKGIDFLTYVASVLSIVFTLDQVKIIWFDHVTEGVSLVSWAVFTFAALMWFFYGFVHKDKTLIVTNFLWVVFSILIVIGIVVYR